MSTFTNKTPDALDDMITNTPAQSLAMLDLAMAKSIGLLMHGAVNNQTNAQQISNAAVSAACAKMLNLPLPNAGEKAAPSSPSPSPQPKAGTDDPS